MLVLVRRSIAIGCGVTLIAAWLLVGCARRAAGRPHRPDPQRLAASLQHDLVELATIAKRGRTTCDRLVVELGPHVRRMQAHLDQAKLMAKDRELRDALKQALAAYDQQAAELPDQIGADLAAAFPTCKDPTALTDLIDRIPIL